MLDYQTDVETRQERREKKRAKKRRQMPKHSLSYVRIYTNMVAKRYKQYSA